MNNNGDLKTQSLDRFDRKNAFAVCLEKLIEEAQGEDIKIKTLLKNLTGKGQAALLILLSLPFCQPIQIPGFSIPFGLAVVFIGSRIAFKKRTWLPQFLLERKISYKNLEKLAAIGNKITNKLLFLISNRLVWLIQSPFIKILNGLMIITLGLLLALPFPIPLGNLFAAYPLVAFGLALMGNDGLTLIVAYLLSFLGFAALGGVIWLGEEGLMMLFS